MKTKRDRFVVFGPQMIRKSEEFKTKEIEIRKRISESYREELAKAPWWRKLLIKIKIEKQIQKELELLLPPHGLYFTTSGKT